MDNISLSPPLDRSLERKVPSPDTLSFSDSSTLWCSIPAFPMGTVSRIPKHHFCLSDKENIQKTLSGFSIMNYISSNVRGYVQKVSSKSFSIFSLNAPISFYSWVNLKFSFYWIFNSLIVSLNSFQMSHNFSILPKLFFLSYMFHLCLNSTHEHGEGNGNPLQYSCLENPMDRGAWWATVHGVAESDTTKQLHIHFHEIQYLCFCIHY